MERLFQRRSADAVTHARALFIAVLFVSTIFAAATGIVGASVTILGIMAAKTMNRSGYNDASWRPAPLRPGAHWAS